MTATTSAEPFAWRCPLLWWSLTYVTSLPIIELALRIVLSEAYFSSIVIASVVSMLSFEIRRRSVTCSTASWGVFRRLVLFLASIVAGLFVILPGLIIADDIVPFFRMLGAFGVIVIAAATGHHIGVEHSQRVSRPVLRLVRALALSPLWVLAGIALLILLVALAEVISEWNR